jgi:ATP adenylyltransferase
VSSPWSTVFSISDRAAEQGALVTVPTDTVTVTDRGIPFVVHVTALQETKARAAVHRDREPANPFLPPDPALFVARLPPRHLSVLNKFNVIHHHLLIVTRDFEPQESLLTRDDFHALTACMFQCDGLAFYNAGTAAGASQPHKHLQLVPVPLGDGPDPTPIDAVVDANRTPREPTFVDIFDFPHSLILLDGSRLDPTRADELFHTYQRACDQLGIRDETQPYNLLLTRRWMLVVPRAREFWNGVSINALGFAGSFLVQDRDELALLRRTGPVRALGEVAGARP